MGGSMRLPEDVAELVGWGVKAVTVVKPELEGSVNVHEVVHKMVNAQLYADTLLWIQAINRSVQMGKEERGEY
jgi:hypothetical protein